MTYVSKKYSEIRARVGQVIKHPSRNGKGMMPISSLECKQMRIAYLRGEKTIAELGQMYNITDLEAGRIVSYDTRDEGEAMPDEHEYRPKRKKVLTAYAAAPSDKPYKNQRPFLNEQTVLELRLMKSAGWFDTEAAIEAKAKELGIAIETMQAILDGIIFLRSSCWPTVKDEDAFCEKYGETKFRR